MIESSNPLAVVLRTVKFFKLSEAEKSLFWKKVEIAELNECWNWLARKDKNGYGKVKFRRSHLRAHRLVFAMCFGYLDSRLLICHKCDNPSCCNPSHLFLGTHADNQRDRYIKGRVKPTRPGSSGVFTGTGNPASKLSNEDVIEIRRLYALGGWSQRALARLFRVTQPTIKNITLRYIWKHI